MYDTTITEKYQAKHIQSIKMAAVLTRIGKPEKALHIVNCGTSLGFVLPEGGEWKLEFANFCRERLCPMCDWRRSIRIFGATSKILDWCDAFAAPHKYLFLTLTVRNCPGNALSDTITGMAAAYHRMRNNRAYKRRVLGAMRTLEVTYNRSSDTYHPHYHLILAVAPEYGRKTNDLYWTAEEWSELWQLSARLPYTPSIKIERVRGRRQGIAEVSKYAVKSKDFLGDDLTDEQQDSVTRTLMAALQGRRLISYTGMLRDAQRALRIKDAEEMDLTDRDDIRGDVAAAVMRLRWSAGSGTYEPVDRGC